VIDEFYEIFHFILSKLRDEQEVSVEMCLGYIQDYELRYINFENEVLEFLEAKTSAIKEGLRGIILKELRKLLEIVIHTLDCLNRNVKENRFVGILESEENMF
jgi:hypothetical protein